MLENKTSGAGAGETFLYILLGLIVVCVVGAQYIDAILDTIGAVLLFICAPIVLVWGVVALCGWLVRQRRKNAMHAAEVELVRAQADQVNAESQRIRAEAVAVATASNHSAQFVMGAGDIPFPVQALQQAEVVQSLLVLMAQRIDSQKTFAPVPSSLHWSVKNDGSQAVAALPGPVSAVVAVPSFSELWRGGQLPPNGFLLGYSLEDNSPVHADWRKLYSALIGGQSGSGKSTLIRNILAQSALQGGRFVVIDPHFEAGEESLGASLMPLRSKMLCDVAASEKQIVDALKFVGSVGQARLHGDGDRTPLILVCDETTGLLQRSNVADELENVLGMISQETRKVGVFALCIGQQFKGDVMNTTVRNSFVSFLSCRARSEVARVMSGSSAFGKTAAGLTTGQCVWMSPSGDTTTLAVPNTTLHDLELVVGGSNSGYNSGSAPGFKQVEDSELEPSAEPPTEPLFQPRNTIINTSLSARAQQVRSMLILGHSQNEIIKEVWEVEGKGRAYQDATAEFRLILSDLVK